jgi:beta-lactamase class A
MATFEMQPSAPLSELTPARVCSECFGAENRYFLGARVGTHIPISDLLNRMIKQSDNFAANVLMAHVGINRINRKAEELGLRCTRVHGMFIDTAERLEPGSMTSAMDCNIMLRQVVARSRMEPHGVAHRNYSHLLFLMLEQEDRRFIPSIVPPGLTVADKTGEISGEVNDAAIIQPFNANPLLFVALVHGDFDAERDPEHYLSTVRSIRLRLKDLYKMASMGFYNNDCYGLDESDVQRDDER